MWGSHWQFLKKTTDKYNQLTTLFLLKLHPLGCIILIHSTEQVLTISEQVDISYTSVRYALSAASVVENHWPSNLFLSMETDESSFGPNLGYIEAGALTQCSLKTKNSVVLTAMWELALWCWMIRRIVSALFPDDFWQTNSWVTIGR